MTLQLVLKSRRWAHKKRGQAQGMMGTSSDSVRAPPICSERSNHTPNAVPDSVLSAGFRHSVAERAGLSGLAIRIHHDTNVKESKVHLSRCVFEKLLWLEDILYFCISFMRPILL